MEIAIIAHDGKKADMVQFLNKNKALLLKENTAPSAVSADGAVLFMIALSQSRYITD